MVRLHDVPGSLEITAVLAKDTEKVPVHIRLFQIRGSSPESISKSHISQNSCRKREGRGWLKGLQYGRVPPRSFSDQPVFPCLLKNLQVCDENSNLQKVGTGGDGVFSSTAANQCWGQCRVVPPTGSLMLHSPSQCTSYRS